MRYTITSHGNLSIQTITFPNISTGIYGFPKAPAAEIAIVTAQEFLQSSLIIKLTAATIKLTR